MSNPILIDPLKHAYEGRQLSGSMPVAQLSERVLSGLYDNDGEVAYTLTGFVDTRRRPALRIELSAGVSVSCGRCLQSMQVNLVADSVITLFISEEKLEAAVEEDDELDAIIAEPEFNVIALIEDEIIMIADKQNSDRCLDFASTGFRDFTRIAASSPEMWRDICLANRVALLAELADYRAELDRLISQIDQGEGAVLSERFALARQVRSLWHLRFQRKG